MLIEFPKKSDTVGYVMPFEDFYGKYYNSVCHYLMKKTGNREDAEDLACEAFIYCYKNYDKFNAQKSSYSTWLYLIVNSRLKNFYRDKRENVWIDELENVLPADSDDMGKAVYLEQMRGELARAIMELPEKQQTAIRMRYFEEKGFDEIAAVLGTNIGNARVIVSRALNKMEELCASLRA